MWWWINVDKMFWWTSLSDVVLHSVSSWEQPYSPCLPSFSQSVTVCWRILTHSSLQLGFGSLRFAVSTALISISAFRSGLWLGQCNTWIFSFSATVVDMLVCLRSLLNDPIPPRFSCQTNGLTFDNVKYLGIQRKSLSTQWLQAAQVLWLQNKPILCQTWLYELIENMLKCLEKEVWWDSANFWKLIWPQSILS